MIRTVYVVRTAELSVEFKPSNRRSLRTAYDDVWVDTDLTTVGTYQAEEDAFTALNALELQAPYFTRLNLGFASIRFGGALLDLVEVDEDGDECGDVDVVCERIPSFEEIETIARAETGEEE